MKDQYVILTGSKNNAGDYLIKYRAKQLFSALRTDRSIIDYDAWKPFSSAQMEEVNRSRALILMGGPALQPGMYPVIYPMTQNLDEIKVPIVTMGIGWKSNQGDWQATHKYGLTDRTRQLLRRIESSGYSSGVRDYHTLNVLLHNKFSSFIMTGCPALYSLEHLDREFETDRAINNISYSLGVSFVENPSMEESMKDNILGLAAYFKEKNFTVVFHHSLSNEAYKGSPVHERFHSRHLEFRQWLEKHNVGYKDISGSAENLIEHYRKCDLHIGFRVHAHIFMSSESKPSLLLNEDGRGKALHHVISGLGFDGYRIENNQTRLAGSNGRFHVKVMNRLYLGLVKPVEPAQEMKGSLNLTRDMISNIDYEIASGFPRMSMTRKNIDLHFRQMQRFMQQLP